MLEVLAPQTTSTVGDLDEQSADMVISQIRHQQGELRRLVKQLYDGRAWLAYGFDNWVDFVHHKLPIEKTQSYRLLEAAEVEADVSPAGEFTFPERHLRVLKRVPKENRREVYLEAMAEAAHTNGHVTSDMIEKIATSKNLVREKWGERAAESNRRDLFEALARMNPMQLALVAVGLAPAASLRTLDGLVNDARRLTPAHLHNRICDGLSSLVNA